MFKNDIKELKNITDALMEVDEKLFEHRDRRRWYNDRRQWEVFKLFPEFLLVIDTNYKIIYINDSLKDKLLENRNDIGIDDIIGKNCYDDLIEIIPKNALSGGDTNPTYYNSCLGGWVSYSFTAIKKENKVVGYVCIFRDNNEKVRMEKELVRVTEELKKIKRSC